MKVAGFGLGDGSGFWRLRIPFGELNKHGHGCYVSKEAINDQEMANVDVVVLKNVTDQMGIASALASGKKVVMDVDDAFVVNKDHPFKKKYDEEATFTFTQTAKAVHAVTTTNEYLARKLRELNKNVFVCPNSYDPEWFNVRNRTHDGPIRIGWAGGGTHEADLKMMAPVFERLRSKYPIKIVARGDTRLKRMWGNDVEVYPVVPIEHYPEALASMAIDIGVCPLEDNDFNHCKSNIKHMEYSLLGVPSVCSPTVYGNYPIAIIATNEDEWVKELSHLIETPNLRFQLGLTLKRWAEENFNIEHTWKKWEAVYE